MRSHGPTQDRPRKNDPGPGRPPRCGSAFAHPVGAKLLWGALIGIVVHAAACGSEGPAPILMRVQPEAAYSDQQTRVHLHGANFVPVFTLDLEQNLRLPSSWGFAASLLNESGAIAFRNLVWLSPNLLQADLGPGAAGSAGLFAVHVSDPRGQHAQLQNAFVSLGPDLTPPKLTVHEPSAPRPVGPGVLLPIRFTAEDTPPGHLAAMGYKIQWREQILVDGRCTLAAQPGATDCAFVAMVPREAMARDSFQITLIAIDSGSSQNATTHTLQFEIKNNPLVFDVAPPWGGSEGGTDVKVSGMDFDPSTKVLIAGQLLIPDGGRWIDSQTITGRTPPGLPGNATVAVQSLTGGARNQVSPFEYFAAPTISSVVPDTVPGVGRIPLTIRGGPFSSATIIMFGDRPTNALPLANLDLINTSEIRGRAPPGVGSTFVWVIDPIGGKTRWSGMFHWTTSTDGTMP